MSNKIPILKLNNGETDYFPLVVTDGVLLSRPIKVGRNIGSYKAGQVIAELTTITDILEKIFRDQKDSFSLDNKTLISDKNHIASVNRDALFTLGKNLKEDDKHTISVNVDELVDNNLVKSVDGKITIDISDIFDSKEFHKHPKTGKIHINLFNALRVDNKYLIKDSLGRLSFKTTSIDIDGVYITRDENNRLCFDASKVNLVDNVTITKDSKGNMSVKDGIYSKVNVDEVIPSLKTFEKGIVVNGDIKIGKTSGITHFDDCIVITGLRDCDREDSAVTKKYVDDKIADSDTYRTIPVFEALNQKSCYEVMTTTKKIVKGSFDHNHIKYSNDVPAGHTEVLILRSSQDIKDMNVIVAWGDGSITDIRNSINKPSDIIGTHECVKYSVSRDDYEYTYYLTHNYPEVDKRYRVTIYGNTYWGIHHSSSYPNLLSRIFDTDLPINNCVRNVTNIANSSLKLTRVVIPAYFNFGNIENFSAAFSNCTNLRIAKGFRKYLFTNPARYAASIFEGCDNLVECDAHIASCTEEWRVSNKAFFKGCSQLKADLVDLLPSGGFTKQIISMNEVFANMKKLTCSNWDYVSTILWGDVTKRWVDTNRCFIGCSDELRKHIPETWGGLKKIIYRQDILLLRNIDEVYNLVNDIINRLNCKCSTIVDDNTLKEAVRKLCEMCMIIVRDDSDLIKNIETLVVSLGAKQLVTIF